jgi:hypothetical protein
MHLTPRLTSLAVIAAFAAIATPAGAVPIKHQRSQHARSHAALLTTERYYASYGNAEPVTAPVTPRSTDGFDWGDAAIGAGGALGLLAISLAGAMTMRRHHPATTR